MRSFSSRFSERTTTNRPIMTGRVKNERDSTALFCYGIDNLFMRLRMAVAKRSSWTVHCHFVGTRKTEDYRERQEKKKSRQKTDE
mmetsp:Transcript_40129/g.79101  ORF Transcript_40129/g.79101 Transcript_40129/m.79101 type:complete len:85 (+) Transcript_40129:167-421(+)